jgi:hypothetical protein
MEYYKSREDTAGHNPGIFNIEELATIWHFPIESVIKAPLMQRTAVKRVEPPMTLPFVQEKSGRDVFSGIATEDEYDDIFAQEPSGEKNKKIEESKEVSTTSDDEQPTNLPNNLPFV